MLDQVIQRAADVQRCVAGLRRQLASLRDRATQLGAEASLMGPEVLSLRHQLTLATRLVTNFTDPVRLLIHHHVRPSLRHRGPSRPTAVVSIVMPVWNREHSVGTAIRSVLAQSHPDWELIIIDDGSTDGTRSAVAGYLADPRIRYFHQEHAGHSAARNRGLIESRGELIAYLDSDNIWYPRYLETVAQALEAEPEADCVYLAQVVRGRVTISIRLRAFDRKRLERANFIDLNVFAHRRRLVEELGGFDESLTRLVDWDLILRYTAAGAPLALPVLGGRYEGGHTDRISRQENSAHNAYVIRRKLDKPSGSHLRVLYAVWHYPQLTESYVRWEIACMRRWGVHVEVWSELGSPAAPFASDVPVHHGSLSAAMARFRPHVVHAHWLHSGVKYSREVSRAGLPLTVRGHGFEVTRRSIVALEKCPTVRAIYLFPHLARPFLHLGKVHPMNTAFNGDLFPPAAKKDPRLVVRASACLPTKDLRTFFDVARRCPQHRFVLIVGCAHGHERYLEKVQSYNRALGDLVDLRISLPAEDVADVVRDAGIYLHTHGLVEPYGMPISIAEAMATGSYVIGRRCAASRRYIGSAGRVYDDAAEAAQLISTTLSWSDEQWHRVRLNAVERAYRRYADVHVLRPLLTEWLAIAGADPETMDVTPAAASTFASESAMAGSPGPAPY